MRWNTGNLVGRRYGDWTVIDQPAKGGYRMCRCGCGTIRPVALSTLLKGQSSSCGECKTSALKPGQRYGDWTIIDQAAEGGYRMCRCDCGTVRPVATWTLLKGQSRGCGRCKTSAIKPGQRFGRLTLLEQDGSHWHCQCDCGTKTKVSVYSLLKPKHATVSCGCFRNENSRRSDNKARTHGEAAKKTPEYLSWTHMKGRCNPNNPQYGGRGIKVCKRWLNSFENFLADMGRRPSPEHSLDRINVDGNYAPKNCRWATKQEQTDNRRPIVRIDTLSIEELQAELNRRRSSDGSIH